MINMTIRELYCTFADFFQNWNFCGFPQHNINFAERNSEAAMGRVGAEYVIFCRCPVAH
jgi:hypothetical protein